MNIAIVMRLIRKDWYLNRAGILASLIAGAVTLGVVAALHRSQIALILGMIVVVTILIGMGAMVLNGATIGRGCLVGAGALVTEGKSFPDHSLIVGAPAQAKRTLDEAAVAGLLRSAAHYVENGRRFAAGLKPIG